jgi:large subunit ribosomal protein L25
MAETRASTRPRLVAASREITGKKVAHLRRDGKLPGVVYGRGVESRNVSVDAHEFELFRRHSGPNTLFDLMVDADRPTPTLVHGVQSHPVTRRPLHVDLLAVVMTEELTVDVPVVMSGESVAVTLLGGTLNHLNSVRIRALPDHLPQSIEVAIDGLRTFEDAVHVRDLEIPSDAHILNDPDEIVARILPPRVVEVEPEVVAPSVEPAAEEEAAAETGGGDASRG